MVIRVFAGENRPLLSPLIFVFLLSGVSLFVFVVVGVALLADCHPSLKLFRIHFETSFIHFINLSFYKYYTTHPAALSILFIKLFHKFF